MHRAASARERQTQWRERGWNQWTRWANGQSVKTAGEGGAEPSAKPSAEAAPMME